MSTDARMQGHEQIEAALVRMRQLGESPRSVWEAIGNYGETSTRLRFKNQVGPDGKPWMKSARARRSGGQTLVLSSRLLRSIGHTSNASGAEWGTNVVYAGIHNHGGKIDRLAFSSWTRLRTDSRGRLLRQSAIREGGSDRLAVFAKATHKRAVERRYTVGAYSIQMPARPFLGVNDQDAREIQQLSLDAVALAASGRGGA